MPFLSAQSKAVLKWGYNRLWCRWPVMLLPLVRRFKRDHDYFPNLLRPRSLNEKILYRMLFDRRKFIPTFAGKLESREFVKKRLGGDDALIPVRAIIDKADDVDTIDLSGRFIMKATHGSGMLYLHNVDTPPDREHLKQLCNQWLTFDFAKHKREWCYKNVRRAVIVEELITDEQGNIPRDYKIFCYDGVPRYIKVDSDRFIRETSDIFDCDWTHIPGHTGSPPSDSLPPQPRHLKELLAMAATLSRGVDFVRVDLYDTGEQVKFGELTTTPARAMYMFNRRELDYEFGSHWKQTTKREVPDV